MKFYDLSTKQKRFLAQSTKAETMDSSEINSALQLFEPESNRLYAIEVVQHLAQVPRRMILIYCKQGLVSPVSDAETDGYYFDSDAIHLMRHMEYLRTHCQINVTGIKLIVALMHEIKRLRTNQFCRK